MTWRQQKGRKRLDQVREALLDDRQTSCAHGDLTGWCCVCVCVYDAQGRLGADHPELVEKYTVEGASIRYFRMDFNEVDTEEGTDQAAEVDGSASAL